MPITTNHSEAFWMVWRERIPLPVFQHRSMEGAQVEAARLAKRNPGCRFWVLESQGFMEVQGPCQWTPAEFPIPF